MDINAIQCNIHNEFDIEVINSRTGEITEKAKAYNMVLTNLWHYIIETGTAFGTAIQYGSGTGTISVSDTSLFNRANGINVTQDSLTCDYVNRVITRRCHINLALSTSVGVNITEVGLAAGTGNGSLTTHAMLQDMNGNPISIAKTEFDIINIYATIYAHWSVPHNDAHIVFYPKTALQQSLTGSSNIFGSFVAGGSYRLFRPIYSGKTWSKTSSSLANKTITYTLPRYSQSEGNSPKGIYYMLGYNNFDGVAISKGSDSWSAFTITNEAVGTGDGTTTEFTTKFNAPYNATVYVNGVAQTSADVTVLENHFLGQYFDVLSLDSTENNFIRIPIGGTGNFSCILYNPEYATKGLTHIWWPGVTGGAGTSYLNLSTSNNLDADDWITIKNGSGDFNISSDKQNNKYFKMIGFIYPGYEDFVFDFNNNTYNIIFNTPPAVGDVITIDYTTDCIPKDSDHVLDASITFKFGDYVPTP